MNRIAFSPEGEIRPAAVVLVGLVLSAVAFAINTLIASAGPPALGAPDEVSQFGTVKVVLATIPAVLGNALGFYMSYRSYDPRALVKFLVPAAGFFVAFMSIPVWGLLAGGTVTAFVVAATLNVVAVAVAVPALLALRPGIAPDNVLGLPAETAVK
ncbi:hypothetical protein GBA65_01755 [Rubrobacter marinus]|uniref:Uncharacterized protein n=1 Tax=Rubrobacter marinus TaxID=2653852 RepID=A0A6G8PSN0_9ACTN|nr:hypothetical protein [Rubrobacter marinus]QIN77440.1 hypothetical protein GBA65_01755 [Rubrobacter marinus]